MHFIWKNTVDLAYFHGTFTQNKVSVRLVFFPHMNQVCDTLTGNDLTCYHERNHMIYILLLCEYVSMEIFSIFIIFSFFSVSLSLVNMRCRLTEMCFSWKVIFLNVLLYVSLKLFDKHFSIHNLAFENQIEVICSTLEPFFNSEWNLQRMTGKLAIIFFWSLIMKSYMRNHVQSTIFIN